MATTDPRIEIVQEIYEAFGRGDVAAILDRLSDDVDWASCPDSDVAPWPATGKSMSTEIHHWWRFRGDLDYQYRGTEDTARTRSS